MLESIDFIIGTIFVIIIFFTILFSIPELAIPFIFVAIAVFNFWDMDTAPTEQYPSNAEYPIVHENDFNSDPIIKELDRMLSENRKSLNNQEIEKLEKLRIERISKLIKEKNIKE